MSLQPSRGSNHRKAVNNGFSITSEKKSASLYLPPLLFFFQKLKHTESDKLQVQIQAYLDNVFDVGALLEDAETKNAALERVEELEENMSHVRAFDH